MRYLLSSILFFIVINIHAQQTIPLTNNMVLNSGDNVIIEPGQYVIGDPELDGIIQLSNVNDITIDATNVDIAGDNFKGYMMRIDNCHNINIKNFSLVSYFYYAIYITNSSSITINGCNFSANKKDDEGWITIFLGPEDALGGGVFMDNCENAHISNCFMNDQNDGVALYNSKNITIEDNDLSWNTAFGIRMYHSHDCGIYNNNCSHVNRTTDPSDCASILLLDAFRNDVRNNDFTYSGDGIFLNNYNTMEPADNWFEGNDCSFSPHNAIEAVFSSGNTFKANKCNYSNYGFWLGYSFNSVIMGNEIKHNAGLDADGGGGIAIDRGYDNIIDGNDITHNSQGIRLWDGNPISPYNSNNSAGYEIRKNNFYGNRIAVNVSDTESNAIVDNQFDKNFNDIIIEGSANSTVIWANSFGNSVGPYINNKSTFDIDATKNTFPSQIEEEYFKACKIKDEAQNTLTGKIDIAQYKITPYDVINQAPEDLAEQPSVWNAYYFVEDAAITDISWDMEDKVAGEASIFCDTKSGWDVHLHYFPEGNNMSSFRFNPEGDISFAAKVHITDPNNPWGVQDGFLKIGDNCGNFITYVNDYFQDIDPGILNQALDTWTDFSIPLSGNDTWVKTETGVVDFDAISYVEFNFDVWEYGYQLWLDNIRLPILQTNIEKIIYNPIKLFPSPATNFITAELEKHSSIAKWKIVNVEGKEIKSDASLSENILTIDIIQLPVGTYFLSIFDVNGKAYQGKFIK